MSHDSRRSRFPFGLFVLLLCTSPAMAVRAAERFEFTRLIAHWADYADPGYLPFIDDAQPEVAQVGFYGAHFWSLADTPFGKGYPAHLPVRGHRAGSDWFKELNAQLHRRGVKVIGHFNVKFLIGDPDSAEGPRGFFRFYRTQWDEQWLGPKPTLDPLEFLERDQSGQPIVAQTYGIGGMKEYWACLNNPAWRQVLKAWVRNGISQGLDGFVANYFYRHDCLCPHCVSDFRNYLQARFTPAELATRFALTNLSTHVFSEIVGWHEPAQSTPLRREMLRFSQIANKAAFDEVFVQYGRSLKPDLIVAQWNHLGNFTQLSGDERCLLPGSLWGRDEDYLWYSTGDAANATDLAAGVLGEATLQARYIRGAFQDKPYTLGKYEGVRTRNAIAELAANGGAPMGFYTNFKDPDARREIVRYYHFLREHDALFRANHSHAEVLLTFPRVEIHAGDLTALERFKKIGNHLLDEHILFDIRPDDLVTPSTRLEYTTLIDSSDPSLTPATAHAQISSEISRFEAPTTVRVSASRPANGHEITLHFVNYNREEPIDKKQRGKGLQDEKPLEAAAFITDLKLPSQQRVTRVEFLAPENEGALPLESHQANGRVHFQVPPFLVYGLARVHLAAADEEPLGNDDRVPWTTSRVAGSPELPAPYGVEKTFTNLQWRAPLFAAPEPGSDTFLVVEQGGEKERPSKVSRVRSDPATDHAEAFLLLTNRLIYSLTFHPGYGSNGYLYVFSNGPTPARGRTNCISRFTVGREAPFACDLASRLDIIQWPSSGHDGGGIVFGQDGMLYITSGDGTSDSDADVTGQTVNDLLGGVLRIDVDHPHAPELYSVPQDNPFTGLTNARPELWAYGLRNPWRMAIDQQTGQIWVGNNGQDIWESVHLIRRGENYGWSVYEGSHPFYLNRKLGPTPAVPPTIEHHHSEARSLTGGEVYYGKIFPELNGAYIYGDYSTGKIWGSRHNGTRLTWHEELADTTLQIAGFAVDQSGELIVVDHGGGLYRLVRHPSSSSNPKFPTRLSETGLFLSTSNHVMAPGIIPYSVNAPGWADGAEVERFIALPGEARIEYSPSESWAFPDGTVLLQTFSVEAEPGVIASRQRIESRLMVRQQKEWVGYSYRWNDTQSDATLVEAKGAEMRLPSAAASGDKRQLWRFPSRTDCMACHSRAANFVLGLSAGQMNRTNDYGSVHADQLRTFQHLDLFSKAKISSPAARLANPYDPNEDRTARVRSYLQVNCSPCHMEAGGGNSKMELRRTTALEQMNLLEARPQHDTFGIDNAMLVAPGDPGRSVLLHRVSQRGRGQMPPLFTTQVDARAVTLFRDWIREMAGSSAVIHDWSWEELLPSLAQLGTGRSFAAGQAAWRQTGCSQCHRFGDEGGSVGPDLRGVGRRLTPRDLLESIVLPSNRITDGYATTEIETQSGQTLTGRIEGEDPSTLILRPLGETSGPITLNKATIKSRTLSKTSNMPTGMVNILEKDQILDLLAYLISDGATNAAAFQKD